MISLLCPTRSRVARCRKLLKTFRETQKENNQLLFYVQNDDPDLDQYIELFKEFKHEDYIVDDWYPTTCMWNKLADVAKGDLLGLMGDDVLIKTKKWDEIIEQKAREYPDKVFLIGVNDGRADGGGYPHYFIHKDIKDLLGFFAPPWFCHRCIDLVLPELFEKIDRAFILDEVLFSHRKMENINDATGKKSRRWLNFDKYNYNLSFSKKWVQSQAVFFKKYIESYYNKG